MGPPMGRANVKTKEEVISKPKEAISSQVEFLFFFDGILCDTPKTG